MAGNDPDVEMLPGAETPGDVGKKPSLQFVFYVWRPVQKERGTEGLLVLLVHLHGAVPQLTSRKLKLGHRLVQTDQNPKSLS